MKGQHEAREGQLGVGDCFSWALSWAGIKGSLLHQPLPAGHAELAPHVCMRDPAIRDKMTCPKSHN